MSSDYSEDKLIEQTSIDIFKNQLGWETINVHKDEVFGANGTLGRASEAEVVLRRYFLNAITKLNPNLPQSAYESAYETITSSSIAKPLAETNFEKYQYLKDGIPVTFKNDKGEIITDKKLRVFNFEDPTDNHFLAVQQLTIEGKSKRTKRPDIIGFVNGIPLVFIELKAHHRKVKVAFETNYKDYKDTIPHLFHSNAFVILSNGIESKVGTITSKFEHFHEWKRIIEKQEGVVSLDTMLRGTCEKGRLLDLFENFILFDNSFGSVIKLLARNHQFIGVNDAIAHFEAQQEKYKQGLITRQEAQKLGVFWHTQGSGKSFSMVFLCQKINRKLGGAFTFLLVTDRVELDKQIYSTFAGVGAVKTNKGRAKSGEDLKALLKSDEKYIFSLIHKFNFEEVITERENIIVISDEAHRTQGGSLALNMRNSLKNAFFMGFTGTPLFTDDELTRKIFGEYVSIYDFKRSVEDGATVPLYYENRGEKLKLDNPIITEQIRSTIEAADLDSDQEDKLKNLFLREYPVLTAEKRLRSIAKDVVWHFNSRGYKGKAMYVAIDKVTAVKMYNYITEAWQKYLEERKKEIEKIDDLQELIIQKQEWQWANETEIAVVISHEQNEISKFQDWGLDIEPHRLKMNTRDLEKEFKQDEHPFRFAIVCAMWITGFDVPSLSTMYIDKPLKTHTLMQTIARANRIHEGKNNGLIVDYIETYAALLEALAIYAVGGSKKGETAGEGEGGEPPVKPLTVELVKLLREAIDLTRTFLKDELHFELNTIIDSVAEYKIAAIGNGIEAIYTNDETKNKFGVLAREVFKKYKGLLHDESVYQFKKERDAINALYSAITDNVDEADITSIVKQVQDVVDASIESLNIVLEPTEDYGKKIDISGLDFKRIEQEFLKSTKKNTLVQGLKNTVDKKLNDMIARNPLRIDFYERYQKIIELYNSGKDYATVKEVFDKLADLYKHLSEEDKRAQAEDLSDDELTVFDMLGSGKKITDKEKIALKEAAQRLLKQLQENEFAIELWAEKVQTASAVRAAINNYLFEHLPYPTYQQPDIDAKTDVLFDFFRSRYGNYKPPVA